MLTVHVLLQDGVPIAAKVFVEKSSSYLGLSAEEAAALKAAKEEEEKRRREEEAANREPKLSNLR
jgi:hypothetical protein